MQRSSYGEDLVVTSSDGLRIALADLGGSGPLALFVHGTGLNAGMFVPLARELRGELRCFGVDLRGHGHSERPEGLAFDWERLAEDVFAAAGAIGGPLVGIGHSAGGASLLLAEANRPGTFRAIFAYEPIVRTPELRRTWNGSRAAATRRRRAVFGSREEAIARFAGRPPFAATTPEALAAYVERGFAEDAEGSLRLRCLPEHEATVYELGVHARIYERLGEVACPVLVAYGSRSDNLGRAAASPAVAALPRGQLVELAGLRHLGPMEDPPGVAAVIRDFLGSLADRPGQSRGRRDGPL